jgi:hypothetical protein
MLNDYEVDISEVQVQEEDNASVSSHKILKKEKVKRTGRRSASTANHSSLNPTETALVNIVCLPSQIYLIRTHHILEKDVLIFLLNIR